VRAGNPFSLLGRKVVALSMTYSLNSDAYHPFEYGRMSSTIQNNTTLRMLVTKVCISFDWTQHEFFYEACNIEIAPRANATLPDISFEIGLDASLATHEYKAGVSYKLLKEKQWRKQPGDVTWCQSGKHLMVVKSPSRNFQVFISHSNDPSDEALVKKTTDSLESCGMHPYVAELTPEPGQPLWKKIQTAIRKADAILILWTRAGSLSGDIREEIGLAIGAKRTKRIIPLVELGLGTRGSLVGLEHIPLDLSNPAKALSIAVSRAINWADKRE
jgi:nucleotide-binding universal stress UspA family protein